MTNDKDSTKSKSKSISPYFLSTSDKLGDKVVQVMLTGDNYDEWSVKLRGALRARKKTGFIDSTIKKPDEKSEEIEDWYMVNAMVVNWIFNVIEPALGSTITYVDEAKILWDDIEQRFSVGNGPKLHRVKSAISSCKQGEKESVSDYYGRLKRLWDERDKYDRNPTCDCGGCKCNINKKLDMKRDESKLHEFLMGLDLKYSTVRSNLLLQEPLPSLNRAYATIIQEEGVRGDNGGSTSSGRGENRSEPIGFAARSVQNTHTTNRFEGGARSTGDKEESSRSRCEKCNRWGHVKAQCFDIIGYPKGWRERGKQTSGNNNYNGGGRGGGHGNGGSYGQGGGAHIARSSEEGESKKEQYISVPKEQWDAYVNNAKGSSSSGANTRMSGPRIEDDDWYG